mgnify:CR=1 FL=1
MATPNGHETAAAPLPTATLAPTPYAPRLSDRAQRHVQGPFKVLFKRLGPDMIALASGMPNAANFPLLDVSVKLRNGQEFPTLKHLQPALQYGLGRGYGPLVAWLQRYVAEVHRPPNATWEVCLSTGNTDAFGKSAETLLNPGDVVVLEHYVYQPILGKLNTIPATLVGVDSDEGGMVPVSLDAACARLAAAGTPARVVYIIPHGQVRPRPRLRRRGWTT